MFETWLWWCGVGAVAIALPTVAVLTGSRKSAWRYLMCVVAMLVGLVGIMRPVADKVPSSSDGLDHLIYVGWTNRTLLREVARGYDRRDVRVLVSPQAVSYVRPLFSRATIESVAGDAPDGVTGAVAIADLQERLPKLNSGHKVTFIAPRDVNVEAVRSQLAAAKQSAPWLQDSLDVAPPDRFGVDWPTILVDAPLLVSPDASTLSVQLIARALGNDGEHDIDFRVCGPKQGDRFLSDGDLAITSIGMDPKGNLTESGASIATTTNELSLAGVLPAPREGATVTWEATVKNRFGESVAYHRATTTARIQPIGVLVRKGREADPSTFEMLLEDLHMEYQRVVVDLGPTANPEAQAKVLERWRVLICDCPFDGREALQLASALKVAKSRPKFLFIGNGESDQKDGALPAGWQTLMTQPLTPELCSMIIVGSDTSISMNDPCGVGSLKKWELGRDLAEKTAEGLRKRTWNRLVVPMVGPDGSTKLSSGAEVTVANYAVPGNSAPWELRGMILSLKKMVESGQPIREALFVFDPDDVDSGRKLPRDAQTAAETLWDTYRVRLWLVSAGRRTNPADLGQFVFDHVVASLEEFNNDPELLKSAMARRVFEEMFPRIEVVTGDAPSGLTHLGWNRLSKYINDHQGKLRLQNGLCGFHPRNELPQHDNVSLWMKHWANSKLSSPLLTRDLLKLGEGQTTEYLHLGLDLLAERAKIPSGTNEQRNALVGMLVRVVGALSDEFQDPSIVWTTSTTGVSFYPFDHSPFQIKVAPNPDRQTARGAGLAVRIASGFGQGLSDTVPDARRLELVGLSLEHLHRTEYSLVRFVVEDQRPEIGTLSLHVPLRASPPTPVRTDLLVSANTPPATQVEATAGWGVLPGWAMPFVVFGFWTMLAVSLRFWL